MSQKHAVEFIVVGAPKPNRTGACRANCPDVLRTPVYVDAAGIVAIVGSRAVLVHVEDDDAVGFDAHVGVVSTAVSPYHLVPLVKDVPRYLQG